MGVISVPLIVQCHIDPREIQLNIVIVIDPLKHPSIETDREEGDVSSTRSQPLMRGSLFHNDLLYTVSSTP